MNSLRSLGTSSLGEVTTTPEVVPVDVSSPNFQMLACTPAPWDGHSVTPSTSSPHSLLLFPGKCGSLSKLLLITLVSGSYKDPVGVIKDTSELHLTYSKADGSHEDIKRNTAPQPEKSSPG